MASLQNIPNIPSVPVTTAPMDAASKSTSEIVYKVATAAAAALLLLGTLVW